MRRLFTRPRSITAALAVTALCAIVFEVLATSTFAATPSTRAAQASVTLSSTPASPASAVSAARATSVPVKSPSGGVSATAGPTVSARITARAGVVPIANLVARNTDTASVDFPLAAGPAAVRAGRESVTYRVAATSATGAAASGQPVTFRLAGVSSIVTKDDLTSSAGAADSHGDVVVTTDAAGLATLTVSSTKTAANNSYSVTPRASATISAGAITSTYTAAAPTTVTAGSSSAAKIGATAELTGKVVDQWGQAVSPDGMVAQLVLDSSTATGFKGSGSGLFPIQHDGTFDAMVKDGTTPPSAHTDLYHWAVGLRISPTKALEWVGSLSAATAQLSSLRMGTSDVPLPFTTSVTVPLADSANVHSSVLGGTVKDSAGAVMKYAKVTYTGSSGVYFVDRSVVPARFATSLTVRTTAGGRLSSDQSSDGMTMAFTTSGPATIAIVSGSASGAVTVPVAKATESYRVTARAARFEPGAPGTLIGSVQDSFGNPAGARSVTVTLSSASAGALTGTDANAELAGFQVLTDGQGAWSAPFTAASVAAASSTLTATLVGRTPGAVMTADPTPGAGWAKAGIVVPPGRFRDQVKITVSDNALSLSTPSRLVGGGKVRVSGTASPGSVVDLYARASGQKAYARVARPVAADSGLWNIGTTLTRTTSYQARSDGKVSNTTVTTVFSVQTVKARALGNGRVAFTVHGRPDVRGMVGVSIGRRRLAHLATDAAGDLQAVVQAKRGHKTFVVTFAAPGTTSTPIKLTSEIT